MLVHPEVVGRAGNSEILAIAFYECFNLVEDEVGVGCRPIDIKVYT